MGEDCRWYQECKEYGEWRVQIVVAKGSVDCIVRVGWKVVNNDCGVLSHTPPLVPDHVRKEQGGLRGSMIRRSHASLQSESGV